MSRRRKPVEKPNPDARRARIVARAAGHTLRSHTVGALPIINSILKRMKLRECLDAALPKEDRRMKIPGAAGLIVLVKNVLLSRAPLYGVAEWGAVQASDLLGLTAQQIGGFTDDRLGRCLNKLFDADSCSVALRAVTGVVREFEVSLDELHNDSTTVTFHGAYAKAQEEQVCRGRTTPAITWGHNKDHRPDLKQVLYILTVTEDGGVPVHFRVESGNTTDDQTHQATWDVLCQLSGQRDFLYVADSKLATRENMAHIHQHGGRFVTILPRTRSEDQAFRAALAREEVTWQPLWDKTDEDDRIIDRFSISSQPVKSSEGYRVIWYHSSVKAEVDALSRSVRIERAFQQLRALRKKLLSPRTRYRTRAKVWQAVDQILTERDVKALVIVKIESCEEEQFRQTSRGRPTAKTKYVRKVTTRYELSYSENFEELEKERRGDGAFPLITNVFDASELDLLWAYKKQPVIEKRFSQLKTDFSVAPVHLHSASRIQAFLCVYFFALLVESLVERELRRAMDATGVETLPLYPEGRPCRRPTTRRVFDLFENVQRHTLQVEGQTPTVFTTELSPLQRKILKLLGIEVETYGR
jgi:transposase